MGLGVSLWIPVFISLMNVVQAVSPVIAHHFGAGDLDAVVRDAREGIRPALVADRCRCSWCRWRRRCWWRCASIQALAQRTGVFLWGICLGLPAALVYRALAFYSASINQTRPVMVLAWIDWRSIRRVPELC